MHLRLAGTVFVALVTFTSSTFGAPRVDAVVERSGDTLTLRHGDVSLHVSLLMPRLVFSLDQAVGGEVAESVDGDVRSPQGMTITYAPVEREGGALRVVLRLRWSPEEQVLRKFAELMLEGGRPCLLTKVILDEMPLEGRTATCVTGPPQSYPAFLPGFFAGIEYPIASTHVKGDTLEVSHQPGKTLQPGVPYTTRTAVYGASVIGEQRSAFRAYLTPLRSSPTGLHVNYNSWWTSSVPFTEGEILGLMDVFDKKLHQPHDVALDTFTIDLGWSEPKSIWEISQERFPQGFSGIQHASERMGAHLGLWISPTCFYSPAAVDTEWAASQGYETMAIPWAQTKTRICCLGGPRYATALRDRLVDMVTQYGIRHVKLDGYALVCEEADHGHAPGLLSSEAIAEGGIAAFQAARTAAPGVWLEATCFGWNPSPWWLLYVNSVIGTFGDDAPHGRVPAPIYRNSYTTARDYFNLQGAEHLDAPVSAQEVLGIIHQTEEDFMDDAVMAIMRGHAFLTMYVNPRHMTDHRWRNLADVLRWARNNRLVFENTEPIQPQSWRRDGVPRFTNDDPMPREPYGYGHWGDKEGLVVLRNPWIAPATVSLRAGGRDGLRGLDAPCQVVSLYPQARLYAPEVRGGEVLDVPLAPYETLVLSFAESQPIEGVPSAAELLERRLKVLEASHRLVRVEYEALDGSLGPDWTALVDPGSSTLGFELNARIDIAAEHTQLLVLMEGDSTPLAPVSLHCAVDGTDVPLEPGSSDAGWSASSIPKGAERWLFLQGALPKGTHDIALSLAGSEGCSHVSVWAYAIQPGGEARYTNALPPPEFMPLDAVALLEPLDLSGAVETERRPVDIERIDGLYLDTLTPVTVTQGWGQLERNTTVTGTPITLQGKTFRRGIGTHAVSRIEYELGGQWASFQSQVGVTSGSAGRVTFEVWVDGRKLWESGLMTASDSAKCVSVNITGGKRLVLVVTDGGDGIGADHANWANARLLRSP